MAAPTQPSSDNRTSFYLLRFGQTLGPFSRGEVLRRLTFGELDPDTPARSDRTAPYQPVAALLDPPTERQKALLRSLSVEVPPNLTKAAASDLISGAYRRKWQKEPITEGQTARLRRYGIGFTASTSKGEAAALIDAWLRAHPDAEARHQRQKAERVRLRDGFTFGLAAAGAALGTLIGASFGVVGALVGLTVGAAAGYQQGAAAARRLRRG